MTERRVVRFGVFELDTRTGELRKSGVKQRLQGRSLQVLLALVERPGEVVTRDELRSRLWDSDVFVDFESGLNTATNRLRVVLGDSAESPRFIETLARTGYRFIAPIETAAEAPRPEGPRWQPSRTAMAAALGAAVVAVAGIVALLLVWRSSPVAFRFRQVTFRHGQIWGARFAPDGQSIVYTANWDNGPRQLFQTNAVSPESRLLGFKDLRLVSVSRAGELALMSFDGTLPITGGVLSRVPINGGAPLTVDRNVMSADWSPDGHRLALVHAVEGTNRLEFPPGTVLHETSGWISSVRMSPSGDRLSFIEHPVRNDNRGFVKVLRPGEPPRTLGTEWANAGGLAWHPSRDEIWVTASKDGTPKSLWAMTLSGGVRPVAQIAGTMTLRDIAPDGRLLTSRDTELLEMAAVIDDSPAPRNLSWLDWSRVADISADGRKVLFDESGVAGGSRYLVYLRNLDDDSTVRLGEGLGMAFSRDGRFALTLSTEDRSRLSLVPLGEGKPVDLPPCGLEYQWVRYLPDDRLLALANEPGQPLRVYVVPPTGKPFPITPPTAVRNAAASPDGGQVALFTADGKLKIFPTTPNGTGRIVPASGQLAPLLWTEDDWLYVQHMGAYTQIPTRVSRFHLPTGRLEPWREIAPADSVGVNAITKVMLSRNARTLVFNYRRVLSELFVAEPMTR